MYQLILIAILLTCIKTNAQLTPAEGAQLHYTLIAFTVPQKEITGDCRLEVADGTYDNEKEFSSHIILSQEGSNNRILARVPSWGTNYTWRIVYKGGGDPQIQYHHFRTLPLPYGDTDVIRLRVLQPAEKHKEAYVFLDCTGTLYDMAGMPVWFVPPQVFKSGVAGKMEDMKLSPAGTVTFLNDGVPYEVNYAGDVLWQAPEAELKRSYSGVLHHEFTRLRSGHYMALGTECIWWPLPGGDMGAPPQNATDSGLRYQRMEFGTVNEYDTRGALVWSWHSAAYFDTADLHRHTGADGRYNGDVHLNSFYLDERTSELYLSFKNISRVLKVKYPDGKVLASYGAVYEGGKTNIESEFYCYQHSCKTDGEGNLYLFNNNTCGTPALPRLVIMRQQGNGGRALKKIWEYECKAGNDRMAKKGRLQFPRGGNMVVLPGGDVFGSLNQPYSEAFIISRDMRKLWSAIPEKRSSADADWKVMPLYRAAIIADHRDMERLIWGAIE